ncbi:hypothetical protein SAMN04488535_2096 [Corynebacterium mycetoides]|uniref:PQQ-like domain-containing protein n=1 Tax=Corynebacterium mycetoides TaxID=38302 RepID=A0A1G9QUP0_9CORY|nr:hypothetical protein [Corynebacterium mycetoides]SDM14580.1 hypothetical protein SAMN04488535_2096 [Corynebacterium mycetoides]
MNTGTPAQGPTRGDAIAAAVVAVTSIALVVAAIFSAPIRSAELSPAAEEWEASASLSTPPATLTETLRIPDTSPGMTPVVAEGLIITHSGDTLRATSPTGETVWTYTRDLELCALDQAWGKVVATYRGNAGCGDVVAFDAGTGQYAGTRSSVAPDTVTGISSNDRVGYVGSGRVELWRSDLVRTVEYGHVEAPQEAGMQPNQCTITSALTRKELLAVTEQCDDGAWLRLQETTPEDSRKPEIHSSISIDPGAYLVAVSPTGAAVYDPAGDVRAYDEDGQSTAVSQGVSLAGGGFAAGSVSDLPHHMSYYENGTLLLFGPNDLNVTGSFSGALGPGFAAGDRLLFAVPGGIAVANWDSNEVESVVPVDRAGYSGDVGARAAGHAVAEKRGEEVVVLSAG